MLTRMQRVSVDKQLFFSVWITEHLYKQFGKELSETFFDQEGLSLSIVLNWLWEKVDMGIHTNSEHERLKMYMDAIDNDDIYEGLDQYETNEYGQVNLISAFYNSLLFIREQDTSLVIGAAMFPLNIIETHLMNEMGIASQDEQFEHILFQQEIGVQERLMQYLEEGKPATSNTKTIFRLLN